MEVRKNCLIENNYCVIASDDDVGLRPLTGFTRLYVVYHVRNFLLLLVETKTSMSRETKTNDTYRQPHKLELLCLWSTSNCLLNLMGGLMLHFDFSLLHTVGHD